MFWALPLQGNGKKIVFMKNIAIIMGGYSSEYKISLTSY